MGTPPLTPETERRIVLLFRTEQQEAVRMALLEECGHNLPFLKNLDGAAMDRYRFAVLKLSQGNLPEFRDAIRLAKADWRDLLVAAGFANHLDAHAAWLPERAW
jgi:hypothetical protein